MKRVYYHYLLWEDRRHGMYRLTPSRIDDLVRPLAASLLADDARLEQAMRDAVREWPFASEMNLSNRSRNRQAWLGQAACCLYCNAPEHVTKQAWHMLMPHVQRKANAAADRVIANWEQWYCA